MVRGKFTVQKIVTETYSPTYQQTRVVLTPQYDDKLPEDQKYAKSTPRGEIWMQVDNPPALAQFVPGKVFYVDFTPVEQ